MTKTEQILQHLVSFPTVSRDSNMALIEYIQSYLNDVSIDSTLIFNDEKTKANLYASLGPENSPGVMLSGHTDVVPIDGQDWTVEPFSMLEKEGRLYGRGTTDMKGFIASVLAMIPDAAALDLKKSIHLAFSYDEEIGCVGVRSMVEMLESAPTKPAFCIVGEPTEMKAAVAHKGKTAALCVCRGVEAHSALTTKGLNAIYLASDVINVIRDVQEDLKSRSSDHHYDVPYTTLHVGTIAGGTALNIIPRECSFKFEIRNLKADDPDEILSEIRQRSQLIVDKYSEDFPAMEIAIDIFNQYPALDTSPEEEVVRLVQSLIDSEAILKLGFGTEGGLFQHRLGIPTVICGPGSMEQGHKPDEFVSRSQLEKCDQFLQKLIRQMV
ncbi:MAG: acetylornithine deacetylase [Gammaproteobacteria bacterium]|nr:acetylornithine deacetylase [Gammaproteobacteria bacterium]